MKIDASSPRVSTTHPADVQKKSATEKSEPTASAAPTTTAKTKIHQLSAKLGVPSHMTFASTTDKAKAIANRNRRREEQKLMNLSAILDLALDVVIADATAEAIDPDWLYAFADLAENIYSPDMQELWGKIFAVEISRPGSFSLKTLETLRRLTQKDAKIFTTACRLSSKRMGDPIPRIITDYHQRKTLSNWFITKRSLPVNLANYGLSYPSLLTLIDLGLIVSNEIESAEFPLNKSVTFRCGDKNVNIKAKRSGVALAYYKFTTVGAELSMLAKRHEHAEYLEDMKNVLSRVFIINGE
ncbi:TIGR03899 family protein [Alteromonas sediminis]|uniref:TIGR03899 family protein n=1 Tax=Alteromonas sediminis TaxID=2259342 RepID=A0A3N5XZU3_9ALTE|nr:TIGR03899 family protein [Alteromonas sediminis]RPJ66250.1 TIGR03899 family protein [Alteromonas sediminis]